MTTPALYACPRHPEVRAELHIPATVSCLRCGKTLRRIEGPAAPMTSLFTLEKEKPRVP